MDRNRLIYLDFRDIQHTKRNFRNARLSTITNPLNRFALSSVDRFFGSHDFHLRSTI